MAVIAAREGAPVPEVREENYLAWNHSIMSWLFTQDHKRIAILYLISITVFFLLGGLFAMLFRIELSAPRRRIPKILQAFPW